MIKTKTIHKKNSGGTPKKPLELVDLYVILKLTRNEYNGNLIAQVI